MMIKKDILTPKLAEKIQDEIYYDMAPEKKVRITSQFFILGRELNKSNDVEINGARRTINQNK